MGKIALPEFSNSLLVSFEPDQQFLIEVAIADINDGEYIDRLRFSFDLRACHRAEIKFVAYQLRGTCSNQNIDAVNAGESLQTRGQIDGITDHGGVKSLMRFIRPNVADQDVALIDPDPHPERHPAFCFPLVIQFFQFTAHSERGVGAGFSVFGHALTFHVPPNSHDGVADEFIEGSSIFENHANHMAQVLVQMSH